MSKRKRRGDKLIHSEKASESINFNENHFDLGHSGPRASHLIDSESRNSYLRDSEVPASHLNNSEAPASESTKVVNVNNAERTVLDITNRNRRINRFFQIVGFFQTLSTQTCETNDDFHFKTIKSLNEYVATNQGVKIEIPNSEAAKLLGSLFSTVFIKSCSGKHSYISSQLFIKFLDQFVSNECLKIAGHLFFDSLTKTLVDESGHFCNNHLLEIPWIWDMCNNQTWYFKTIMYNSQSTASRKFFIQDPNINELSLLSPENYKYWSNQVIFPDGYRMSAFECVFRRGNTQIHAAFDILSLDNYDVSLIIQDKTIVEFCQDNFKICFHDKLETGKQIVETVQLLYSYRASSLTTMLQSVVRTFNLDLILLPPIQSFIVGYLYKI